MTENTAIKPFEVTIPQARLDWIAERIRSYPWTSMPDAGGWSGGTSISFMRSLCDYWLDGFDWRAQENAINSRPQFVTHIGGNDIQFCHLRSAAPRSTPLLLLHGWPGSVHEFDALAPLLTSASADGFGFDLVIPSLPGYGFSTGLNQPIGTRAVADIMAELMQRLGYDRYLVQGGDWGAMITTQLGIHHAKHCLGIHLNMVIPGIEPAETPSEQAWQAGFAQLQMREGGYSRQQMTRPQTLGFAMADSPVGAAAWIIEKFAVWSDLPRAADGTPDVLARYTMDQLLTNVMYYVGPDSFVTATWLYHGLLRAQDNPFAGGARCTTPTGIAAFPDPTFPPPPRSMAAKSYDIVHWSEPPRGGHFAAMEQPELLAQDFRAFAAKLAKN